ncbi:MAG: BACON domain-containing carbohydrate-binding protein, partial [Bacteroidales bacterium]
MKIHMRRFLLFCLLAASSCIAQSQDIGQIIAATSLDSLVKTVRILSGEDSTYVNGVKVLIKSRSNTLPGGGNDKAADYIKARLLRYNLSVEDQAFNTTGRNILATQPGLNNPDSIYIICAHYDAVANYCADDNASGVSFVIEAARILSGYCFDNTILYALWDNEEDGQWGSSYYAQIASSQGYKIAGVLNVDMAGYDSNNDRKFDIHTNSLASSLALKNKLISTVNNYHLSLIPNVINPGTTLSDHGSFWNKNFGAVCFSEYFFGGDPNPYYHSDNDRINRFNLPYFYELGKLGIGTLATVAELIPSCQADDKTLSVSPGDLNIVSNAGSTSFDITSNTSWTITDNADWLTINPASGSGNGTITVTYTANSLSTARVGTITISGTGVSSQQVTVTQSGINTLSVIPSNRDVGAETGSTTFTISSNTSWTITDNADWLTVNPASGSGNGTITVTYTANSLATARVATITISGTGVSSQQVTVTQSGINTLSVIPSNRDAGAEAGSTTFTISSNTSWTITDNADWLTVNPASGSGNGTITATYTANTLTTARIGTITISGTGVSSRQVTV